MVPAYKRKLKISLAVMVVMAAMFVFTMPSIQAQMRGARPSNIWVILSALAYLAAMWCVIRGKARSAWWILAPIMLNLIGLFIVVLMRDDSGES